jgi:hypothetical protein
MQSMWRHGLIGVTGALLEVQQAQAAQWTCLRQHLLLLQLLALMLRGSTASQQVLQSWGCRTITRARLTGSYQQQRQHRRAATYNSSSSSQCMPTSTSLGRFTVWRAALGPLQEQRYEMFWDAPCLQQHLLSKRQLMQRAQRGIRWLLLELRLHQQMQQAASAARIAACGEVSVLALRLCLVEAPA